MLFCKSMLKSDLNSRKQFCFPDTLGESGAAWCEFVHMGIRNGVNKQ